MSFISSGSGSSRAPAIAPADSAALQNVLAPEGTPSAPASNQALLGQNSVSSGQAATGSNSYTETANELAQILAQMSPTEQQALLAALDSLISGASGNQNTQTSGAGTATPAATPTESSAATPAPSSAASPTANPSAGSSSPSGAGPPAPAAGTSALPVGAGDNGLVPLDGPNSPWDTTTKGPEGAREPLDSGLQGALGRGQQAEQSSGKSDARQDGSARGTPRNGG